MDQGPRDPGDQDVIYHASDNKRTYRGTSRGNAIFTSNILQVKLDSNLKQSKQVFSLKISGFKKKGKKTEITKPTIDVLC